MSGFAAINSLATTVATPAKKCGRKSDSSPSGSARDLDLRREALGIKFADTRREDDVGQSLFGQLDEIAVEVAGIAVEILMRRELGRVDEDTDDDALRARPRLCNKREMPRVQRAHGRHKSDAGAFAAPVRHRGTEARDSGDDSGRFHARESRGH
jgi:hypothetical protein